MPGAEETSTTVQHSTQRNRTVPPCVGGTLAQWIRWGTPGAREGISTTILYSVREVVLEISPRPEPLRSFYDYMIVYCILVYLGGRLLTFDVGLDLLHGVPLGVDGNEDRLDLEPVLLLCTPPKQQNRHKAV